MTLETNDQSHVLSITLQNLARLLQSTRISSFGSSSAASYFLIASPHSRSSVDRKYLIPTLQFPLPKNSP